MGLHLIRRKLFALTLPARTRQCARTAPGGKSIRDSGFAISVGRAVAQRDSVAAQKAPSADEAQAKTQPELKLRLGDGVKCEIVYVEIKRATAADRIGE